MDCVCLVKVLKEKWVRWRAIYDSKIKEGQKEKKLKEG